jgi:hypothetical protein
MSTATANAATRDEGVLGVLRRGNLGVLALAALLLAGGWLLRGRYLDERVRFESRSVSLEHPAGWLSSQEAAGGEREAALLEVLAPGSFRPRITIGREKLPAEVTPAELSSYVLMNLQRGHALLHRVAERALRLEGRPALRLDYAFAVNPAARPDEPAATDVPVTVRGSLLAVMSRDGALVRVVVEQSAAQREASPELADRVLSSVRLR